MTGWILAVRKGDKQAAQDLFERYFSQLMKVSRQSVRRKRSVEDEEDAAITALNALLQGIEDGKFPNVHDRNSLWPLLVDIVIKQSKKQLRRQRTAKRNEANVFGETELRQTESGLLQLADFALDDLSTQTSADLADLIQVFRSELPPLEQEIFDLKLHEYSNRQIAKKLGRPPTTIDRKLRTSILPRLESLLRKFQ